MKERKICKTYSVKIILYISEKVEGFILKRHFTREVPKLYRKKKSSRDA